MGLMDLFRKKDRRPSPIEQRQPPPQPAWSVRLEIPSRGQAPSASGVASWLPPGHACQVAGRSITGGGFYVGGRAAAAEAHIVEPALVDPSLKVDWERPDWSGATMGYWPSYSEMTPNARASYLSWLSGPRSDPSAYIGYVFVYFYGFERRALHDLRLDPTQPEMGAISAEVRRLLGIYGNGSFQSYASRFLALLEVSQAATGELALPTGELPRSWEVPFQVRVALGRYCAAGQPIPPEWALVWLRTHPESYLRTPATRCAAEFDELFTHRYRARFKDGMVIKPPKVMLVVSYDTASAGFQRAVDASVGSLPDVAKLTGPVNKLKDIASECTDALDSYSRYLGRNPDGGGTPGAIALLPDELLASHGGAAIDALRGWCHEVTADGAAPVPLDYLIERWSPGRTAKLAKAEGVAIGGLLGKLGFGIEPDVRFGASTPAPDATVVLFALPPGATDAPSPEYAAAATLVHLAAVVATSDGSITDAERQQLAHHLETVLGLDPAERVRLEAHLLWLAGAKSGLGGLKKRIDALSQARRAAVGQFLVDVAASDGLVNPEEITMLTKLYKLLGLDESAVYSAVHALGAADSGPAPLTTPGPDEVRWPIPPPTEETPTTVRLDPDKIRTRLAETATVTALLADIFTEDDELAAPASAPVVAAESAVAGLDGPHSALATRLTSQPSWDRAALEAIATGLGLPMLEAAVDRVNDAAIDACGEPLVEGDDPYEINDYTLQELF